MQQDPQTRLSAPAVGLIVTGGVGALLTLGWLAMVAFAGVSALAGEDAAEALPGVGVLAAGAIVNLAVAGLIIYGGLQMRAVRGWGISMAAAIAAMIPCVSPCCILGLPIGIWAVLVLIDEDIKRAFNGIFPGGPGGGTPYGGATGGPYGGPSGDPYGGSPYPTDPYPRDPYPGGAGQGSAYGGGQYPGGPAPGPYPGGPPPTRPYPGSPPPTGPYPGSPPPGGSAPDDPTVGGPNPGGPPRGGSGPGGSF